MDSGKTWCPSCRTMRPSETVKLRKRKGKGIKVAVMRCDVCESFKHKSQAERDQISKQMSEDHRREKHRILLDSRAAKKERERLNLE